MSWVEDVLRAAGVEVSYRKGDRLWALCPWHEDKKATNFFVRLHGRRRTEDGREYSAAGQCHCFSCGGGGSIVDLVQKAKSCTKTQAQELVDRVRGHRDENEVEKRRAEVVRSPPRRVAIGFVMPAEVAFEPLADWVTPARRYAESRGITQAEVDAFGIGYAVDGPKLGGRIVLPWRDQGGVARGYSARTWLGAEPKYTTPGPEERADRSVMFGEHLWPNPLERSLLVVTEGALNALAVRRVWSSAAVAALGGSGIDTLHALKIATFARVLVLTDPDAAGEKAARDLGLMVGRYSACARVRLPDGVDAMDAGPERLHRELTRALTNM